MTSGIAAAEVLPLISHFADRKQEHFICLSLNGANEVITSRVVSVQWHSLKQKIAF